MPKTATKTKAAAKARTKSQIIADLAEQTELTKKDVRAVLEALSTLIKKDLSRRGPGTFTIPGLVKLRVVRKPATKERWGVNPFTGERQLFKAKPARKVVRATPLKALKDMVK